MNFYVYILSTIRNNKIITYTGYTSNLNKRLLLHNSNKGAKFTKGSFWKIVYYKKFSSKNDALKYEHLLKKNRYLKRKVLKKYK